MITLEPYPKPWPGYTVPEFGGNLNGAEEDAAMLSAVVADAKATQSIHREMIQHMADWEARQPGVLSSDDELRNQFITNLDALRSAFTDRGLQTVGVSFPMLLDRANPAHAVILAVRDDIADSRDRLQANQAQALLGKQIAEVRISLPEFVAHEAAANVRSLTTAAGEAAKEGAKGLTDLLKTVAWVLGGGVVLYIVTHAGGGK